MDSLGTVIAERRAQWGVERLPLERMLFGSDEPDRVAATVNAWCRIHLDAAIARYVFFDSSSGSVHGVTLDDGRNVVVKGHRPTVTAAYLASIAELQTALANAGYPAPRPLIAPTPIRAGHMTAEEMLPRGGDADAHAPAVRAVLARGLVRFIELARPYAAQLSMHRGPMQMAIGDLYPTPHSPRFDFAATAARAEWIDDLATSARAQMRNQRGTQTVVHGDWRIQNLCVREDRIVAVYDWDSISVTAETSALATAATTFSVDWQAAPGRRFPTPREIADFITDYEQSRGEPLRPSERTAVALDMVASLAYGARCEHAVPTQAPPDDDSQRGLLRRVGAALLAHGLDGLDTD